LNGFDSEIFLRKNILKTKKYSKPNPILKIKVAPRAFGVGRVGDRGCREWRVGVFA